MTVFRQKIIYYCEKQVSRISNSATLASLLSLFLISVSALICSLLTLLIAATLQPSVPSAVYFLVFIITLTSWACLKDFARPFAVVCRILLVLLIVHIFCLLAYQTPYPQEVLPANNTYIRWVSDVETVLLCDKLISFVIHRFLGFSPLIISNCTTTDVDLNIDLDLDAFLNPVALFLCYYILAISSSFVLNQKVFLSLFVYEYHFFFLFFSPCNACLATLNCGMNGENYQILKIPTILFLSHYE